MNMTAYLSHWLPAPMRALAEATRMPRAAGALLPLVCAIGLAVTAASAVAQQDVDRIGVAVRDGQIQRAVPVEVGDRDGEGSRSHRVARGRWTEQLCGQEIGTDGPARKEGERADQSTAYMTGMSVFLSNRHEIRPHCSRIIVVRPTLHLEHDRSGPQQALTFEFSHGTQVAHLDRTPSQRKRGRPK